MNQTTYAVVRRTMLLALLVAGLTSCGTPADGGGVAGASSALGRPTAATAVPSGTSLPAPSVRASPDATPSPAPSTVASPDATPVEALTREAAAETVRALLGAWGTNDITPFLSNELRAALASGETTDRGLGLHAAPLQSFEVRPAEDRPSEVLFVPATLRYAGFVEERIYELVVEDGRWRISGSSLVGGTSAAPVADGTSRPLATDYELSAALGMAVLAAVGPQHETPVLVGLTHVQGDWAAALVQPQGGRTIYAFLQHSPDGWAVVEATSIPSANVLRQRGVPEALMEQNDDVVILNYWMAQLQDPRGEGAEGYTVVERVIGDHARVRFNPADVAARDPFTAFLRQDGDRWIQVLGGTAFLPEDLAVNDLPAELWP